MIWTFSSPRIDLIEDQFDVAFRMGELDDAGFVARKLMTVDMVTIASPSYVQQYGMPKHPKELAEHRTLTGSVTRWSYRKAENPNDHADVVVKGNLRCKNGRALVMGALHGNGIIRVPLSYCAEEVELGQLIKSDARLGNSVGALFRHIPSRSLSTETTANFYRFHQTEV